MSGVFFKLISRCFSTTALLTNGFLLALMPERMSVSRLGQPRKFANRTGHTTGPGTNHYERLSIKRLGLRLFPISCSLSNSVCVTNMIVGATRNRDLKTSRNRAVAAS